MGLYNSFFSVCYTPGSFSDIEIPYASTTGSEAVGSVWGRYADKYRKAFGALDLVHDFLLIIVSRF
jgi:hypothetical protein